MLFVTAVSETDETLGVALVSQDDHFARCVLSSDPAQRVTQLSRSFVSQTTKDQPVLYGGVDSNTLTIVGTVPASVTTVRATTPDQTITADVRDQTYAIVMANPGGAAAPTSVKGFDVDGAEVFVADAADNPLLPTVCFNTVETNDDGCWPPTQPAATRRPGPQPFASRLGRRPRSEHAVQHSST